MVCMAGAALAHSSLAAPQGRYARQLADECDALIALAVKRPYGWAWAAPTSSGAPERKPPVDMRPPGSPAAGIVLLWAGLLLEEPKYVEAAVHVARGVVASQASNGNVVSQPTFGTTVGKREPPAAVPDRAATNAGLALLLAVVGADESKDEIFRRAALRATGWLIKQQAHDGGWPSATPESATDPRVPARLIRLDDRNVRDSTLALLLCASAADDRLAARAAHKAVEKLLALRISAPGRWNNLWSTFYRLNGSLEDDLADLRPGADMLASRRVVEVLLTSALVWPSEAEPALAAAREAARSIRALRDTQGNWMRLYVLSGEQPTPAGESIFGPASTQPSEQLWQSGIFALDGMLAAFDRVQELGPERMGQELSRSATVQERLASTIVQLSDSPFVNDRPETAEEVDGYLSRHADLWRLLEGPPPEDLNQRVKRLYALLLRTRVEAQFPE